MLFCGTVFVCYNPSDDSWSNLPFNPTWTTTDDGASLTWAGGEYLYSLQGEWQETVPCQDFSRYHIPTETWTDMSPIPDSEGVGDGGSLLWIGNWLSEYNNYIFSLGGGESDEDPGYNFYRYIIPSNSWEQLESIPSPIGEYVGNRLGFADDNLYYWQGTPSTWDGGGKAFYMFELNESQSTVQLLINEVELNPPENDNTLTVKEWVELYNPTSNPVDLSGWRLSTTHGETVTVTLSGTIGAKGYYIYERGNQWLDNNNESVILRDNYGIEIDKTPLINDGDGDNGDYSWQRYPNGGESWSFKQQTKGYSNDGNNKPFAFFTYVPSTPKVGELTTFDASSSYDSDGFITNYRWNFFDGTIINTTDPIIIHSYPSPNDYFTALTVTDNEGATNTSVRTITVIPQIHDINISTSYSPPSGIKILKDVDIPHSQPLTIGENYTIGSRLLNEGDSNETVNVTIKVTNETYDTVFLEEFQKTVNTSDSEDVYRTWDTTNLKAGDYTITINASIPIDDDWTNNERTRGVVLEEGIEEPELTSIEITPLNASLNVGETQQFAATGYDQYGVVMTGIAFTWSSSNGTVGTVDSDGFFTASVPGSTWVNATNGSIVRNAGVTIADNEPTPTPTPTSPPQQLFGGGGGGRGLPTPELKTDRYGKVLEGFTKTSSDGKAKLTIPLDTIALDSDENPLKSVSISLTPIGGTIAAYNMGPDGATFNQEIELVIEYDLSEVKNKNLKIKVYEGGKWIELKTTVNPSKHTATAKITHFTVFALFAETKATAPTPTIMPTITQIPSPTVTPLEEESTSAMPWPLIIVVIFAIVAVLELVVYIRRK